MDSPTDDIGVVRVTVSTAVAFIANLQRRDEKPFLPRLRDCSLDRSLCPDYDSKEWGTATYSADEWVDSVIPKAEEKALTKSTILMKLCIELKHLKGEMIYSISTNAHGTPQFILGPNIRCSCPQFSHRLRIPWRARTK
jgi:hypothetical protein